MREARRGPGGGTWGLWFLPQNAKSDRFDPQNLRKTHLYLDESRRADVFRRRAKSLERRKRANLRDEESVDVDSESHA